MEAGCQQQYGRPALRPAKVPTVASKVDPDAELGGGWEGLLDGGIRTTFEPVACDPSKQAATAFLIGLGMTDALFTKGGGMVHGVQIGDTEYALQLVRALRVTPKCRWVV